jgi:2-oxoglutarate dehydrogenase E2 component (dihydrolipoamide succinyltransferase)
VTEGTILRWAKAVGQPIVEDEVLLEISTDKVDTEVPSPASGTILEILVSEGDTVSVGTPLVVIGEAGEAPVPSLTSEGTPFQDESAPPATTAVEPAPPTVPDRPSDSEVEAFFAEPDEAETTPQLLSPVVRRLIREHEVDVSRISGTGHGGRITRRDVELVIGGLPRETARQPEPIPEAVVAQPVPALEVPAPTPAPAPSVPAVEPAVAAPDVTSAETQPHDAPAVPAATAPGMATETVELDRLRIRIAENMIKAKQTAAHVWTSVEVDYERVERVRQAAKTQFKADEGFSLTYLPFISRATIDALKAFPVVNSSFNLEQKTAAYHKNVDLGIAIDLNQNGLVVARVRNADGLRLVGIARSIRELADRGRDEKLGLDDLTGSTFTITNPGPFGSFMSAPIINIPNVAILSTDTVTKRPTVITTPEGQDMIAIRHIGYLGLTWDHRVFDGSTAVLFLKRIKENLETWDWAQELA